MVEILSLLKAAKALSFRQARISACQSASPAKTAFVHLSFSTLPFYHFVKVTLLVWICACWLKSWVISCKVVWHCSHFFSLWTQIITPPVKQYRVRTFILLLSKVLYLCHIFCIPVYRYVYDNVYIALWETNIFSSAFSLCYSRNTSKETQNSCFIM